MSIKDGFPRAPPAPADAAFASAPTLAADEVGTDVTLAATPTLAGSGSHPAVLNLEPTRALDDDARRYEAAEMLGVGGMGEVRLHLDHRIGRNIARKTLRSELVNVAGRARFVREARVQGQLEHPNIVPVYDLGIDASGRPFFTMKRVRGRTLADVIDGLASGDAAITARFSRHKLLTAFVQVCHAVEYAHARGIVHRDLKPGNIMIGDFGEVYVLDWGLAKLAMDSSSEASGDDPEFDTSVSAQLTRAGDMIGTPIYMAPELLVAPRDVTDDKPDVYALGATLFEILTLSSYRPHVSIHKLAQAAQTEQVVLPSSRVPSVPAELDALCAAALAPDPTERSLSVAALAVGIEQFLEGARDEEAKRLQAGNLLASAQKRLAASTTPELRVGAMRDALKALALTPDDAAAQRLLLSLVVDGSGSLPSDAEREFQSGDRSVWRRGVTFAIYGYVAWLASLPLFLWIGARSYVLPAILTTLTLATIVLAAWMRKVGNFSRWPTLALAALTATTVALSSCWLGPFVVVPLAAASSAILFVLHSPGPERRALMIIWAIAAVAPFVVESLGVVPPAYSFEHGEIVLHARVFQLTPTPTILTLAYVSVSFLLLTSTFVGRLRDEQRAAERRLFVQAWTLRQLFPGAD